MHTDLSY